MKRLFFILLLGAVFFTHAFAYAREGALTAEVKDATKAPYGDVASDTKISTIVGNLINGALALLGTVFLVLLLLGGYRWMTASGNEEDITKAKSLIWQAVMGLLIIMAAMLITQFVLKSLTIATQTTP